MGIPVRFDQIKYYGIIRCLESPGPMIEGIRGKADTENGSHVINRLRLG
jgi:hypothetical protein